MSLIRELTVICIHAFHWNFCQDLSSVLYLSVRYTLEYVVKTLRCTVFKFLLYRYMYRYLYFILIQENWNKRSENPLLPKKVMMLKLSSGEVFRNH